MNFIIFSYQRFLGDYGPAKLPTILPSYTSLSNHETQLISVTFMNYAKSVAVLASLIGFTTNAVAGDLSPVEKCDTVGRLSELVMNSRQEGVSRQKVEEVLLTDKSRETNLLGLSRSLIDLAYQRPVVPAMQRGAVIERFVGAHIMICWRAVDGRVPFDKP